MVLDRQDAGLVYAPPSLDFTNELVRKYNARFGAGKPAAGEGRRPPPPSRPRPRSRVRP